MAEPPRRGRGTHHPWGKSRRPRRRHPTPSPTAHLAGRTGLLRGTPCSGHRFHPSPPQRAVGRNLALDLVAAVGVGVRPPWSRRCCRPSPGAAASSRSAWPRSPPRRSSPTCSARSPGRVGPRSTAPARASSAASAPRRCCCCSSAPTAPVMIAVSIVFWLSLSFGGPFHLRLWGAMYPARLRGRVVGPPGDRPGRGRRHRRVRRRRPRRPARRTDRGRPRGPRRASSAPSPTPGFRAQAAERPPGFSARESIRALRERPILSRIALAQGFYGGGLIAALPLYAIVYVDRLDLSLSDVGIIGILTVGGDDRLVPRLGRRQRPHGPARGDAPRERARPGRAASPYALAPSVVVLWVAALAAGAGERLDRCRHRVGRQRPHAAERPAPPRWPAGTRSPARAGSSPRSP